MNGRKIMATAILSLAITIAHSDTIHAQTFAEWFSQNRTQRRYLVQQVAGLQAYIGYARTGYDIARRGLNVIGDLRDGEFNLYRDFFGSLRSVNPAVKNYARIADIVALQARIIGTYRRDFGSMKRSNGIRSAEMEYIGRVYGRLLDDCSGLVDELITVATDGKVEMTDDERIRRIDQLYKEMQACHAFVRNFGIEALQLDLARTRERDAIAFQNQMNQKRRSK